MNLCTQALDLFLLQAVLASLAGCSSTQPATEQRRFAVRHSVEIAVPEGAQDLRAWIALPSDRDPLQELDDLATRTEGEEGGELSTREVRDQHGNRFLALDARGVAGRKLTVSTTFDLTRREARVEPDPDATRPLTEGERRELGAYLAEGRHDAATPAIRAAARTAVGDEQNPVRQARLLYDWVLGHVQYWVKSPATLAASGVGSSSYAFEKCTGNCTDFHSLYTAAARSIGLPTRMVYGSFLKAPLDGQERDQSYHCWIEFWAPRQGWIPLDVAVADLFVDDFEVDEANAEKVSLTLAAGYPGPDPALVEYYFGNLEARRVTWHYGRDLELPDGPAGGPLNALPKAVVEVDGVALAENAGWKRTLTFRELDGPR